MRIAVIGLGFMGATHARCWTRIAGAQLDAVVSSDPKKLAGDLRGSQGNLGRESGPLDFSRVRKYKTAAEAFADPEIDAVDICTPTDRHAELATAALREGKHVLVEKPLALTTADAELVVREAELAKRVLMVGQVLRFLPPYVAARDRLRNIGAVRSAFFRRRCAAPEWGAWLQDAERSGGGAFDLLIHDADYVRWLFGMPVRVNASGVIDAKAGIDIVTAELQYPGASVTINGGWHGTGGYPFSMEFTMVGESGSLEWRDGSLNEFRRGAEPLKVDLPDVDLFEAELAHFHECALNGRASEICPAGQSVDAVQLMNAILTARAHSAMLTP